MLGGPPGTTYGSRRDGLAVVVSGARGCADTGFTLDEFALWVRLEDVYWTDEGRISFDAVVCTFAFAGSRCSARARSGS